MTNKDTIAGQPAKRPKRVNWRETNQDRKKNVKPAKKTKDKAASVNQTLTGSTEPHREGGAELHGIYPPGYPSPETNARDLPAGLSPQVDPQREGVPYVQSRSMPPVRKGHVEWLRRARGRGHGQRPRTPALHLPLTRSRLRAHHLVGAVAVGLASLLLQLPLAEASVAAPSSVTGKSV